MGGRKFETRRTFYGKSEQFDPLAGVRPRVLDVPHDAYVAMLTEIRDIGIALAQ